MSSRQTRKIIPLFTAEAADGVSTALDVSKYDDISLQVSCEASTSLTLKFQASLSNTAPDFSAAQTASNHWDYVAVYDYQDPSATGQPIPGDTGISFSAVSVANSCTNYLVNVDNIQWLSAEISSHSAGSVTVNAILAD